jgi:hypothetical protein
VERVQRNVTARSASFGGTDAELTALIPGIQPVLLLIKQVDQGGRLNGRLPLAYGPPRLERGARFPPKATSTGASANRYPDPSALLTPPGRCE